MKFDIEDYITTVKPRKLQLCRICNAKLRKSYSKDCDRCQELTSKQLKEIIKALREQLEQR